MPYFSPPTPLAIGTSLTGADVRSIPYIDGTGAWATSINNNVIGTTGVGIGYLKLAEHLTNFAYLGHSTGNTSSTNFQIRLSTQNVTIKAPGGNADLTLVAGDSGVSNGYLMYSGTIRFTWNNTGIGWFGATPSARSTGWTAFANGAVTKTLDTATASAQLVGQVLGTLIEELKTKGLLAT